MDVLIRNNIKVLTPRLQQGRYTTWLPSPREKSDILFFSWKQLTTGKYEINKFSGKSYTSEGTVS